MLQEPQEEEVIEDDEDDDNTAGGDLTLVGSVSGHRTFAIWRQANVGVDH